MSLLFRSKQLDKLLGAMGEVAASVLSYGEHIFDTAAVFAGDINAGFAGDYLTDLKNSVLGSGKGDTGSFMDISSHAVAETVAEAALLARFVYYVACDLIKTAAAHSRARVFHAR